MTRNSRAQQARYVFFVLLTTLACAAYAERQVELVKDLYPGSPGSIPTAVTNVNGTVFFIARDGVNGSEKGLFMTDGTPAGTKFVEDLDDPDLSLNYRELTARGSQLLFRGNDNLFGSNGRELWGSFGTSATTALVKDIFAGSDSSDPDHLTEFTEPVAPFDEVVLFQARHPDYCIELWRSDGTTGGTFLVKDINPGSSQCMTDVNFGSWSAIVNGIYYFNALSNPTGPEDFGMELWRSDGTPSGTFLVKDIFPGSTPNFGANWSGPALLTDVNGTLLFAANDEFHGRELWKSDGTAINTVLAADIFVGDAFDSSLPSHLTAVGDTLFFMADSGPVAAGGCGCGRELWKWTSAGGAQLVEDLTPGSTGSAITEMVALNGMLFFVFDDSLGANQFGNELWSSDGSAVGTGLVKDVGSGVDFFSDPNDGRPTSLTVADGLLYFSAWSPGNGRELWQSDGTDSGTTQVADLANGSNSSNPADLEDVDGTLFFSAVAFPNAAFGTPGWELFRLAESAPIVTQVDSDPSTTGGLSEGEPIKISITQLTVTFDQNVVDPAGSSEANDVTNSANYLLVEGGPNGSHETDGCGGVTGDDSLVVIDSVAYDSGTHTAALTLNGGALPGGFYRLFVCGTIENSDKKQLDGNGDGVGGDDFLRSFTVRDSDGDGTPDGEDGTCSGTDLVISSAVYEDGETIVCTGSTSLTTSGLFVVGSGANVTLISPSVSLSAGAQVAAGGVLQVHN